MKYNDQIYLSAANNGTDYQLHKYDPVTNQTTLVQKINTNGATHPSELTVYNNRLYFIATDGVHGYEVWQYDTVQKAKIVADIYPGSAHSYPRELTVFDDKLYFSAESPTIGRELYTVFDTSKVQPPNTISTLYENCQDQNLS